jgi:hypothetical protein
MKLSSFNLLHHTACLGRLVVFLPAARCADHDQTVAVLVKANVLAASLKPSRSNVVTAKSCPFMAYEHFRT